MKNSLQFTLKLLLFFVLTGFSVQAATHKITGVVKDELNGEVLIGANVVVDELFIGAATDVDGKFEIYGIPDGPFTLVVKFVGYEELRIEYSEAPTEAITINLKSSAIVGEEFVVTALARGQMGAINTQLNALQIKNVVSAAKMDEIPDATAAEAIGRLPGITVQRDGGEGNKVSVRGLGAKHNTMSVEGVTLLSTDAENRSVDISMIAPNVLSGVQVTKALTSDMIASSLGGAVDMTLKTAQEGDMQLDASFQGGYNTNISALSDYKGSMAFGQRYLDNKLGVMIGGYVENRYRGKDIIDPKWIINDSKTIEEGRDSTLKLEQLSYQDIDDNRFRFGGSVVIDYQLPFGQIKLINFGSRMNIEQIKRQQDFGVSTTNHNHQVTQSGDDFRSQMVNKISGDFDIFGGKLSAGFSHSVAERNKPEGIFVGGWGDYGPNPVMTAKYRDSLVAIPGFDFRSWVNYINVDDRSNKDYIHQSAANIEFLKEYGIDREYTSQIDYEHPIRLGSFMSGKIKTGFMYKYHSRFYDSDKNKVDVASSGINHDVDAALRKHFPDIYINDPSYQGKIEPKDAWSTDDFDQNNFFGGEYNLYPFIGMDHMKDYAYYGRQYYEDNGYYLYPNISSYQQDQEGTETYTAGYIMAEFKFWKDRINVIPGIRYEQQTYQYSSYRVNVPFQGSAPDLSSYVQDTTADMLTHTNFFPSVQAIIKPVKWADLRLAWNKTVSRPDYNAITARYSLDPNSAETKIEAGNPNLRPQISENLDLMLSFHGNRFGLLSLGVFRKNITDLIEENEYLLLTTEQADFHGLPHNVLTRGVDGAGKANAKYKYSLNNQWEQEILGFEADYQPNLHFLPYPFNGLLFNANVTYLDSKYERYNYDVVNVLTPIFPGSPIKVPKPVVVDTSYMQHTSYLTLNASLGYSLRGFTVHVSMLYKPTSLKYLAPTRKNLLNDEYYPAYSRIDVKMKQKLNSNLELFFNLNNLTDAGDIFYRNVLGAGDYYVDKDERYGRNFHLGIRYRL